MKLVTEFLKMLDIQYNRKTILKYFSLHPYHPSFLAISDLLDEFNIDNAAVKISKENFSKIPTPFIAKTESNEGDFCLVTKINHDKINI